MRARPRPAVISVLLVAALSLGVFATSSLAVQGTVDTTDELLARSVPFETLRTIGGVTTVERRGERKFRLDFQATYHTDGADQGAPIPDILVRQTTSYPALSDEPQFVGPAALPFRSQLLVLRVKLLGDCFFASDQIGTFVLRDHEKCVRAILTLDGKAFNVSDLLISVNARLSPSSPDGPGKLVVIALFEDPGYPFPIASVGDKSHTTFIMGDFGSRTTIRRIRFFS